MPIVSVIMLNFNSMQSHMNKDHSDDTKLIVQYSTTVKASKQENLCTVFSRKCYLA